MIFFKCCVTILFISSVSAGYNVKEEIRSSGVIRSGEDLVAAVTQECLTDDSIMSCLRHKVLSYVSNLSGFADNSESGRDLSDSKTDQIITRRLMKYLNSHEFKVRLPKFLFEEAVLTFSPSRGLADFKIDFPQEPTNEERSISEGMCLGLKCVTSTGK